MFGKFFSLTWGFCTYLFHNRLMASSYFIITYILCLFFILFHILFISAVIQMGIITNILCWFFICIGSHIIIMYCLKFENQCFILHLKLYIKLRFIFFRSVLVILLFIVISFTSILFIILNSNY